MENSLNTDYGERVSKNSTLENQYLTTNDVTLKPKLGILKSRSDAELSKYIYSSPMDTVTGLSMATAMISTGEYPVVCRFIPDWNDAFIKYHHNPDVFFAIGTKKEDTVKLINILETLYPDVLKTELHFNPISISLDIAHGDSKIGHDTTHWLSQWKFIGNIMSGTVCTPEGALRAIASGCTHIRVGVGSGSACTTRLMTGCGMPNLTAVYEIHKAISDRYDRKAYKIIADGGIKYPGDAVKYIAAGADAIMLGNALSKCPETPGWNMENGVPYKHYRGQASRQFQEELLGRTPDCAEGAVGPKINHGQTCEQTITMFRGGMRSALSYLGLTSMSALKPENVDFVQLTAAGFTEGTPHGT